MDNEEDAAMEATNSVAYTNNVLAPILADMEEADRLFVEAIGDDDDAIISDTLDQSHLLYLKARHDLTEPQGVDRNTYSAYSSLDSAIERYTS